MKYKKLWRATLTGVLIFTSVSWGQAQNHFSLEEIKPPQQSSEYIFRSSPKESLISIQLLGAVNKPGIYYVPTNTDLLKVLTLAGGTSASGDLTEILVRKSDPDAWVKIDSEVVSEKEGAYAVNAEKVIKVGGAKKFGLHQDDFVFVPTQAHLVSSETSRNISIFSVMVGIVLTSVLIDKNLNQRP